MNFSDRFRNEIREITQEEKDIYLPVIRRTIAAQSIAAIAALLIISAMILYFIIDAKPEIIIITAVIVLFGSALLCMVIRCICNICNLSRGNLGVIHIMSDNIDCSSFDRSKPPYYIKAAVPGEDKQVRYPLSRREYETIRCHFGHLKEIDYIVVNPEKIKYKDYGYAYILLNEGAPVIETAVYDNISKAVNNLSSDGAVLSVKKSDN